jgi:hypothetical protein
MWYLHLSTYVLVATCACAACRASVAWSLVFPLHLLCTSVVLWSHGCTDPSKYAVMLVKVALLCLAWARCGTPRTGVAWVLPALGVAGLYVALGDVQTLYGCVPAPYEYAATVLTAAAVYGGAACFTC